MYDSAFETFVAPARARPQLWRLLLGLALILFAYIGFGAIMIVVLYPVIGPLEYFGWLMALQAPQTPPHVLFVLLSFVGMFLGPVLAAAACHYRSPLTLFGPRRAFWRGLWRSMAVLIPLYGLLLAATWRIDAPVPNLDLSRWLMLLPLAVPLLIIQITAEELIFRAYLPQQLAARFSARWVWMLLPALLFAVLHYNPAAGSNALPIIVLTGVFALIATDLTARTGALGPAIAMHFVNNFVSMLVVSLKGTITGLALFTTPYATDESGPVLTAIGFDLVLMLGLWLLLRFVLSR